MSGRRKVQWACGCAVVAIAASMILIRHHRRPLLPAPVSYANLPGQFNRALQIARARAEASGRDAGDLRELARLYQANRLYAEARACYGLLRDAPGGLSARDHYYLAAIAQDESDLGSAQAELRSALRAEPGYLPARAALSEVLFKSGQTDAARAEYAAILAMDPGDPQASIGLARIELQGGNDDGALARLREMIAGHPESASGAALLAHILDRRGEAEEAAAMTALSQQLHEPVPPDPWTKAMLADCYDAQRLSLEFERYRLSGQMDEALPLMGRLEEIDPKSWIPPMLRGWSQKEAGHYPEAVREYRLALTNGGDPEKICPLLAAALLTQGDPAAAAALLGEYRAKSPHSIPILLSYCEVAVRLKDEKLARGLLEEVLRAEPYLYMPNMSMVQILWNAGERDAAAQCLLRVARVFPADVDSRGLLGQYYMERSDPRSAIGYLEQAVAHVRDQDPRRERLVKMLSTAYLTAGSLEATEGRFAEALSFSEKSIKVLPEGLRGYALKANLCRKMKDFKGEAEALGKISSLEPDDPGVLLSLGDAVYRVGDGDKARGLWQRALRLAPAEASDLRDALGLRLAGRVPAEALQ